MEIVRTRKKRVLFLYKHKASGVLCCQPDYFLNLREARKFYARFTAPHIEAIQLIRASKKGHRQAGIFYPYEEPDPEQE